MVQEQNSQTHPSGGMRWLAWMPLVLAALSSYGHVDYNYGFALYFLDYRHGFVKRGLVGEMLSPAGFLSHGALLGIEYAFLAAAFALTYVVFRRLLFGPEPDRRLGAVLLAAPAALPHIGYLFAQPDVTLYLLVLVCVWLFVKAHPVTATLASLPLCCLGLLGHEAFSLMFYPLVLAILLYLCVRRRLSWSLGLLHVAVMAGVFVTVLHTGTLKVPAAQVLAEAQARTDARIQPQVYQVMASSLREQRALVHQLYSSGVLHVLAITVVLSLPYFALLTYLLWRAMRQARCPGIHIAATGLLFLSPLLLCALGHDTTRWIGAMCLDATLFLLVLHLMDEENGPVQAQMRGWASGSGVLAWMAYFVAIGPYGATGIRAAEQMYAALSMR